MVSLLGQNVYKLNIQDIEYVFRTTYASLTHSFGPNEGVKLLENPVGTMPFDKHMLTNLDKLHMRTDLNSPD